MSLMKYSGRWKDDSGLIQRRAALPDDVRDLYNRYLRNRTRPDLEVLARLLEREAKLLPVFVVVDALDECPERNNTRDELIAEFQKLSQNAHVLITSRYSQKIENSLGGFPQIDIKATDDDVRRYVEARIEQKKSLSGHVRSTPSLREEISETITRNCQGMFLLAQLHMDSLARKLNIRGVRAALRSLPIELDETYEQALQRIKTLDEEKTSLAYRVLYWISYSYRPLTVAELKHALATEPDDDDPNDDLDDDFDEDGLYETDLMVTVCAGLVTVDEESNQIRLVHYTAQDYFERIRTGLFLGAPSTIAMTCLRYLLFKPFSEIHCSTEEELAARLDKYPFLGYAASYWGDHIRDEMNDDIRRLALEYLGNSIRILSTYQAIDEAKQLRLSPIKSINCGKITRLHVAALFNLVDIARNIQTGWADVNARTDWGMTPLYVAAEAGHTPMVDFLLQAGANVASKKIGGLTPLHIAARNGHEPVKDAVAYGRKRLADKEPSSPTLDKNDEIRNRDKSDYESGYEELGRTPLNRAAEKGHDALVLMLLNNKANISATDEKGQTALHQASQAGHIKVVEHLIATGIDVLTRDESGQSALHYAARTGQEAIIRVLMQNNADVLAEDFEGKTAVDKAAMNEHETVVKILLEHMGKEDETERWIATALLRRAVEQADEVEVDALLRKGADPNVSVKWDVPLLHFAVTREDADVLQLLLVNGADVDIKESYGRTPLHWAAYRGYSTGVRLLLGHGADIQAADNDGATPLHMATEFHGSALVVEQLLQHGAQPNAKDRNGETALSWLFGLGIDGCMPLMDEKVSPLTPWTEDRTEDDEQKSEQQVEAKQESNHRLAVLDLLILAGADLDASYALLSH
ncbi:nacht and ankyrin domain containing protein [Grosmannia clavigera kw1407]|uniref:Nacht and ankyrin domain containing protein n=1 Tax=Grosmannia clavigera (strain kw1407 / UAMH 11150) TaxID=655863 RepID=F0XLE3_GROCL|nr:nacht and ankyrin domain containing protein [Grosmannia clavigera kw1407]EFX01309.1 nacht and ankyrin domain containing protein [Grosmannia clavigera kw1407]